MPMNMLPSSVDSTCAPSLVFARPVKKHAAALQVLAHGVAAHMQRGALHKLGPELARALWPVVAVRAAAHVAQHPVLPAAAQIHLHSALYGLGVAKVGQPQGPGQTGVVAVGVQMVAHLAITVKEASLQGDVVSTVDAARASSPAPTCGPLLMLPSSYAASLRKIG